MNKKHRFYILFILFSVIFAMTAFSSYAALTQIQIEQVKAVYPQLTMYYYAQIPVEGKEMKGYLNEELFLPVNKEKNYGTDYYILLDISGSLKEADFIAAKENISAMAAGLTAEDSLILITFGDEVIRQFRIDGTDEEMIQNARELLDNLKARDQTTHLYQALQEAMKLSQAEDTGLSRQIMLVISDGADVSADHVTLEETEAEVKKAGIPIYALCTKNAEDTQKEDFGKLARNTGGTFTEFDAGSAEEAWTQLKQMLKSCRQMTFAADKSGNPPIGEQTFILQAGTEGDQENYTIPVSVQTWEKDMEPPRITYVSFEADKNALVVGYSEAVEGADQVENYLFVDADGQKISISRAEALGKTDEMDQYCLYFGEIPASGEAILSVSSDVTDASMEKNQVAGDRNMAVPIIEETDESSWIIWLAIGGAGLLLAGTVFAVCWIARRKRQKSISVQTQKQTVEHIVRHIPAGDHLQVEASRCSVLSVHMTGKDGRARSLELPVNKSAIAGRTASQCEICIEDERVSRQHCVFEERTDGIYLRDLDSRNGTYVNGIRLGNGTERRLFRNDMLRIGDTVLRIDGIRLKMEGSRNG